MKKRKNDTQHRRVFTKAHGRPPHPGYHIHHIDGNPDNNTPANLAEVTPREHFDIHKQQKDWGACIKLASCCEVDVDELAAIQQAHGKWCVENKVGIHSDEFDRSHLNTIWTKTPPGRKPVTDGRKTLKFKTDEDVDAFLASNPSWRHGLPESSKQGLKLSSRRITSEEAKILSQKRLTSNQHNFIIEYTCPYCGKNGKGPMMKRWHFENCRLK